MSTDTKMAILEAFNRLQDEMVIDKITVDRIVLESGVSKSTFYRHFLDKYDVMNFNYTKLVEDVFAFRLCKNWREVFQHLVTVSDENRARMRNAYCSSGANSYPEFLYSYSYDTTEKLTRERRGSGLTSEESVKLSMFCYATVWIIRDWVNGQLKVTAEELSLWLYESMPESLRIVW